MLRISSRLYIGISKSTESFGRGMAYYVFSKMSRDSCNAFIIEAESEILARGKAQKEIPSYLDPPLQGTVEELMAEEEEGVLALQEL